MEKVHAHIPETVVSHICQLGEGPVWDADRQTICWVDILSGVIHEYDTGSKQHRQITVGEMVGAIALTKGGQYLAALESGLAFVDRESGTKRHLLNPEAALAGNRFNDGKCDPAGRFWIGSMSKREKEGAGSLYMVDKHLACTKKLQDVSISNGLAWSLNEKTLYFIDSLTAEVAAFDYNVLTGNITNKRMVIRIAKEDGLPDGMTIDTEGMLWIAHWNGWQVARYDPATGEKLLQISLPVSQVTSCTFGGKNLRDLYITTAAKGLEKEAEKQPLAGSLFVIKDCGFQGLKPVLFNLSE